MNDTNRTIIISHNAPVNDPRFHRNSNGGSSFAFIFSLVWTSNTVDTCLFPSYRLWFLRIRPFIFVLNFFYRNTANRLSIPGWMNLTIMDRRREKEERKEYGCSNWTSECSISSVVKFFATRGKAENDKISRWIHGASFTCSWKLHYTISFFSFLIFAILQTLRKFIYANIYISLSYYSPLLLVRFSFQKFHQK